MKNNIWFILHWNKICRKDNNGRTLLFMADLHMQKQSLEFNCTGKFVYETQQKYVTPAFFY